MIAEPVTLISEETKQFLKTDLAIKVKEHFKNIPASMSDIREFVTNYLVELRKTTDLPDMHIELLGDMYFGDIKILLELTRPSDNAK